MGIELFKIPILRVDNQPAITVSLGPSNRSRTTHIDFTQAVCRDYVARNLIDLQYVPTVDQLADIWTKQLGPGPFLSHRARFMGFVPVLRT